MFIFPLFCDCSPRSDQPLYIGIKKNYVAVLVKIWQAPIEMKKILIMHWYQDEYGYIFFCIRLKETTYYLVNNILFQNIRSKSHHSANEIRFVTNYKFTEKYWLESKICVFIFFASIWRFLPLFFRLMHLKSKGPGEHTPVPPVWSFGGFLSL